MTSRFFTLLLLIVPAVGLSQPNQMGVVNNTACTYLVTYHQDNGTPCTPGGGSFTMCVGPFQPLTPIGPPATPPANHLYVSVKEIGACAIAPGTCFGPTYNLGLPPVFAPCPNYLGYPNSIPNQPSSCGCPNGPFTYEILSAGGVNNYVIRLQ